MPAAASPLLAWAAALPQVQPPAQPADAAPVAATSAAAKADPVSDAPQRQPVHPDRTRHARAEPARAADPAVDAKAGGVPRPEDPAAAAASAAAEASVQVPPSVGEAVTKETTAERPPAAEPAAPAPAAPMAPFAAAQPLPAPAAPAPSPPPAPVHQATVLAHPLSPGFAREVAAQVHVLAEGGLQRAELHLHPADLGPVHVQLTVSAQTADVQFTAAHAATREGLGQALPQLRELLAANGLQLGQADIGSGSGGGAQQRPSAWPSAPVAARLRGGASVGPALDATGGAVTARAVRGRPGMLDLYA